MILTILEQEFAVCKLEDFSKVKTDDAFYFTAKTAEENSLVCLAESVPENVVACDNGWRAFKIEGILDFSMIGILSKISSVLAENEIGIFVVSTYNTDYILVKCENLEKAAEVLKNKNYEIRR